MKWKIEPDKVFLRRANKLLKRNPSLRQPYLKLYETMENNPFAPRLHTHSLTGDLKGRYACSLTYELRIVFRLYDDIVHLLDIGSHDEVY